MDRKLTPIDTSMNFPLMAFPVVNDQVKGDAAWQHTPVQILVRFRCSCSFTDEPCGDCVEGYRFGWLAMDWD